MRCLFEVRPHALGAAVLLALGSSCTPAHLGLGGDDDPDGFCGDGRINGDETCDDFNSDAGDGCSAVCQPEIPPNCGDGILIPEEGEECDDGNMVGGDGCGLGCWIESCGNGFLDVGEACEDNNNVSGDGCSDNCKSDESCGNGFLDSAAGEMCDDGNNDDTDGCPASCEPARCGDGFVRRGVESCDDGNGVAADGCTDCILDTCGNATMDPGEECDQGAANGSDNSSCFRSCLTTDVVMNLEFSDNLSSTMGRFVDVTDLTLADMNGDGVIDCVATDRSIDVTQVSYGKGNGLLATSRHLASYVSNSTDSILLDVNGDGVKDIVAVGPTDFITVALGTSTGFALHNSFTTVVDVGGSTPRAIAAAELTGDAFIDIVTSNTGVNDVTLLEGDGAGNFTAISRFGVQSGNGGVLPVKVKIGDVTGDGTLDIVTANQSSSDVAVLAGLGGGAFAAPEIYSTVIGAQGTSPTDLVLADVTNDAKLDVLTANQTSSDVTVLAQQGGALANPLAFQTFDDSAGLRPLALAVGDVNKDGVPDIVTANNTSDDVSIILGLGAGVAFGPPTIVSVSLEPDTPRPSTLALGDLNADNTLDIVVGGGTTRDVRAMVGNGDGSFKAVSAYTVDINGSTRAPTSIHISDVDGDGHADVLAQSTTDAVIIAGNGQGRLFPSTGINTAGATYTDVADIDSDGRPDMINMRASIAGYRTHRQQPNGVFAAQTISSVSTGFPTALAFGDFDNAGGVDFVSIISTQLELQSGDGAGAFVNFSPATINLTSTASGIAVADLTGDGDLDIAVTLPSLNEVNVMVGDGAGGFTNPAPFSTQVAASGSSPVYIALADIDGASGVDMLTANSATNDITLFRATGNGTFAAAKIIPAVFGGGAAQVSFIETGDVNGDGILDLITTNRARSTISVIIGFGNGNFAAPQTFDVATPSAVGVLDVNGDDLADITVVNSTGDVTIFVSGGHP